MRRVLVARLDSVGDVLLAGPAVRAVAAGRDGEPSAVSLLCGPQGAPAAERLPGVAQVLVWSCPWIANPAPPVTPAPTAPAPPAGEEEPFGLTPRERQVLSLVAAGATNREIGTALYMAEKTASVHVSRILAKLDVRSRTEAGAVAHRFGFVG